MKLMKNFLRFPIYFLLLTAVSFGQTIKQSNIDNLLKRAEETHSEAVIIYQDKKLVAEKYFGIGKPDTKIETMSCTKSIVGLAVACMLSDGVLDSLDVPVWRYYPEWRQGQKQNITIRHLVQMTSGLQNNPSANVEIYPSPDFVQLALAAELVGKPGEVWNYNNKSLNLMAGVIKKITGKRMDTYIGERLFKPLGITDFTWTLDSAGNPHVMSGCQLQPRDFAKIGLLLLNGGMHNSKQIIAANHIAEIVKPCEQFKAYGMLWWLDYERAASIIDDEIITELQNAQLPAEFVDKVFKIKGFYASNDEYYAALDSTFGKNSWEYTNKIIAPKNLRLRKREFSGNVTYRADGYLGNYIIVDPVSKIVAVRMISHQSFKTNADNFLDFRKLVLNLTN
ncbi:MAG: serine hydrolase domain-containing protein [Bacteroidota bacterium]